MRHRKHGRTLGRSSSHRRALMRNLASALFLTLREDDFYEGLYQSDGKTVVKPPHVKGRIVTTLAKAKEARRLVEKCITIARHAQDHLDRAVDFGTDAERHSDQWRSWRNSEKWHHWNAAIAPALAARRRVFAMLRNKEAVAILFEEIAPRLADREGGYTRVMRLAKPRLGDAGPRAILELVGTHDKVRRRAERPAFEEDDVSPVAPADKGTRDGEEFSVSQSAGDSRGDDDAVQANDDLTPTGDDTKVEKA